ncbi:MAG TPA: OmpA family protein [Candidatus Dormibacteraeota bacterium]|nr:OmpA family protein [Candidatus Dormibacteraeota bacterium]
MRNRICITLLVLFALAAVAQQTNNSSNSTPASTSASQSDREPLASPRPTDFWDGDDPNFVNLITHPFASKKYVQRQVGPIRDRVNELDELTSETSRQVKDVDSRAQQGIQMASEKTNLADQHAADAVNKAQLAQTAATQASTRVSSAEQMVGSIDQYKGAAQTEIRFRPGQSALSKNAKDALDEMAAPLKGQRSYIIEVRGFSAGQGQAAIKSSQQMADSVVRYLVLNHEIPVYRIYVMSMGNVPSSADGKRVVGGRVEVNVLKNDLVTSAQR